MNLKSSLFFTWRFVLATILLSICFALGSQLVDSGEASLPETEALSPLALVGIVAVQALIFCFLVDTARWSGWPLITAIFVVYFGVCTILPQMDTWYFAGAFPQGMALSVIWMGLLIGALFSPMLVMIWRKLRSSAATPDLNVKQRDKLGLFLFLPTLYLVIYLLFGYYVAWQFEAVRIFYNDETILLPFTAHVSDLATNSFSLFPFQFFRGVLWAGLVWLILRLSGGSSLQKTFLVAGVLAVPASLLLIPNPYMPEAVRMAHFWETFSSNVLFGLLAGKYFCRG